MKKLLIFMAIIFGIMIMAKNQYTEYQRDKKYKEKWGELEAQWAKEEAERGKGFSIENCDPIIQEFDAYVRDVIEDGEVSPDEIIEGSMKIGKDAVDEFLKD